MTWHDWLHVASIVCCSACAFAMTFLRAGIDDAVRERLDLHAAILRVLRRRSGLTDKDLAKEILADEHDARTGLGGTP